MKTAAQQHVMRKQWWPLMSVIGGGLLLSYPVWRYGMSANGDAVFHSIWYTNFARQFFAGEMYPRWLLDLNGGLGSPVFFFYAPLPYYATLLFSPWLPIGADGLSQLGASAALALCASGVAAYLWLKRITKPVPAACAAIFYLLAPYHLRIDLYTRVAFAEIWAFVWMPLVLYFVVRARGRQSSFALVGVALTYAALSLTHLPSVVIFSLIPPLYAFGCSGAEARRRATLITIGGMLLGVGLASIYLLPALTMQATISVADFTASAYHERWLRFQAFNFDDLKAQLFWCAALTVAISVGAFLVGRRTASADNRRERLFWLSVAWVSALMMFPLSNPLWRLFAALQAIQFPWRFNAVLCLAAAALLANALAAARRPSNLTDSISAGIVSVLVLACAMFAVYSVRAACPPGGAVVPHEVFVKRAAQRRDATEYRPVVAASIQEEAFGQLLERICKSGGRIAQACVVEGAGTVAVTSWRPRDVALEVSSAHGVAVNVSQFYYAGWVGSADGQPLPLTPSKPDGLLHLTVPNGAHHVRLRLTQSWPEVAGKIVSVVAALLLMLCLLARRKLHFSDAADGSGVVPEPGVRWWVWRASEDIRNKAVHESMQNFKIRLGGRSRPVLDIARDAVRRPLLRELLIVLAFVVLTAVMSWPWVCHLRDAVHDVGDPYTIAYTLWWDYHQTFHDPLRLFDATIFYPYRDTLAFSENDYGIALLFFPLFAVGLTPLTVHSVATLCAFVLSGYGAFRLTRTLTGSYPAAWVAGIVFAFIPYRFHRLPHLHYIFAGWIPLVFEALVLYARRQSWRRAAWLAAAFLMNALTCITWFILSLIPLMLAAVFLIARYHVWRVPRFWWRATVALSLTLPVLAFFLLPYQRVATLHGFVRKPEEVLVFSALPINWLVASDLNRLWRGLGGSITSPELILFPGLLPPLLTLIALLSVGRFWHRSADREQSLDAGVLSAMLVVCGFAFSFGPNFFVYRWLFEYLWIFKSQRVPAHWAMFCYLGLALGAGLGAVRVVSLVRQWRPGVREGLLYVLLLGAILCEQWVAPLPFAHGRAEPDQLSLRLRQTPMRGGLVELPTNGNEALFSYVLRAADHERPLITATSSFFPPLMQQVMDLSQRRPIPDQFFELLESAPASYLVVHYGYLMPEDTPEINAMLLRGMQSQRLRFIRGYEDAGRVDLYAVTRTEPQARTEAVMPPIAGANQRETAFAFTALPHGYRETGFFIYRLYQAAFGRAPTLAEFAADDEVLAKLTQPDAPGWEERLQTQARVFVAGWIERPAFKQLYDRRTLAYIADKLAANTGAPRATSQLLKSAADADGGTNARADVLLRAVEDNDFIAREFNAAFITMHYFGLLRRDPDKHGFDNWLDVVNKSGNYYLISQDFSSSDEARAKHSARQP